jgi:hypothetical protein
MAKLVPNLAIDIFWGASIYQLTNIFLFARGAIANFPGGLFLYIYISGKNTPVKKYTKI